MKKLLTITILFTLIFTLHQAAYATELITEDLPTGCCDSRWEELGELGEWDGTETPAGEIPAMFASLDAEDAEDIQPNQYYGYQTLLDEDEDYAFAYRQLVATILNRDEEMVIDLVFTASECRKVLEAVINDFPQFFYVSGGEYGWYKIGDVRKKTSIQPTYVDGVMNSAAAEEFEEWAEIILDKSGVEPWMSDYDKALMLHDELAARITYHDEAYEAYMAADRIADKDERDAEIARLDALYPNIHTAYGSLVEGKAVCDGYAKAYQYLLHKMGILSHVAAGWGNGGGHAWNLVQLDGKWYYTDLTWDDKSEVYYAYFNMTYQQLTESGHQLFDYYAMPRPDNTEHNYFVRNGEAAASIEDVDMENVTRQMKENSYARIYITETLPTNSELQAWIRSFWEEFQKGLDATKSYQLYYSKSQQEYHIKFLCNNLLPVKNHCLEIVSSSNQNTEVVVGYYDENDILLSMEAIPCTLKAGSPVTVNAGYPKVKYHKVRYFVWNNVGSLQPIYHPAEMTY